MAASIEGVTCKYGVTGTQLSAELVVQSYSISSSFISEDTVTDENGLTITWRANDRTSELTVEGIAKTINPPKLGDVVSFTLATNSNFGTGTANSSFVGVCTKVEEKGGSKEFVKVSITAKDWEGIAITAP